jgi:hypothetical protein
MSQLSIFFQCFQQTGKHAYPESTWVVCECHFPIDGYQEKLRIGFHVQQLRHCLLPAILNCANSFQLLHSGITRVQYDWVPTHHLICPCCNSSVTIICAVTLLHTTFRISACRGYCHVFLLQFCVFPC